MDGTDSQPAMALAPLAPKRALLARLQQDLDAVERFLANETASATRRAYKSDFRIFVAFCDTSAFPSRSGRRYARRRRKRAWPLRHGFAALSARTFSVGRNGVSSSARAFAAVLTALARIGSNVNQIARAMNVAVLKGEYAAGQGSEAREAAAEVQRAIAQLAGMVGCDLDYWGADTKAELPAPSRRVSPSRARVPR